MTSFEPDIYPDKGYDTINHKVFNFTKETYFPINAKVKSLFYGTKSLNVGPFSASKDIFDLKELTMNINQIKIDDSIFFS